MMTGLYSDFQYDGWTPAQYEYCMKQAYAEQKRQGVERPHVTYTEALAWHRQHAVHRVIPAAQILEEVAA